MWFPDWGPGAHIAYLFFAPFVLFAVAVLIDTAIQKLNERKDNNDE